MNGVDFSFPTNVTLPAGGVAVVASIDAQQFRLKYSVPPSVVVFGPYAGSLSHSGELIELQKPGTPTVDGLGNPVVPYITVDAVRYSDSAPWPTDADGNGPSLTRIDNNAYGDDPVNWRASVSAGGTPGNARVWDGGGDGQHWTSVGNWDTNNLPNNSTATALVFKNLGATYSAGNDFVDPFNINNLVAASAVDGNSVSGFSLQFGGTNPAVVQSGSGAFTVTSNIALSATLGISGDGTGALKVTGVISGSAAVTKSGTSAIELSGANTYSAGTTVGAGVLAATNATGSATGSGAVAVNANALLRGSGSVAGTVTVSGGRIAPGSSAATGTLTTGAANFGAGGILAIRAKSPGNVDRLNVSSQLTMGGTSVLEIDLTGFTGSGEFVVAQTSAWSSSGFKTVNILNAGVNVAKISYKVVSATNRQVLLAVNTGVTPVKIDEFRAQVQGAGVRVSWKAVSEFQNAGFHIYRRVVGTDDWSRVNAALIAGRITSADEKMYAIYDWVAPGVYEYRLDSVSIRGEREAFARQSECVRVDGMELGNSLAGDEIQTAAGSVEVERGGKRAVDVGEWFAGIVPTQVERVEGLDRDLGGELADDRAVPARSGRPEAGGPSGAIRARQVVTDASGATAGAERLCVGARWFSAGSLGKAAAFGTAKVLYDKAGVLFVPRSAMPGGFDLDHAAVQREGRSVTALAVTSKGMLLYGPGYQDDYTDKDAFFIRASAGATVAGRVTAASGLFAENVAVNASSAASVTSEFHDIYFDYHIRPYSFEPWFSSKYLTGGTTQAFSINAPGASVEAATLTVKVWSLTETQGVSPDHALQVLVNGQTAGQAVWSGGNKMLQVSFQIAAGTLVNGANTIELVTPTLDGVDNSVRYKLRCYIR